MHPIKTGKFKGCVKTEILIVGSTRPVASIFKLKSIKGDPLGTWEVFGGTQFSQPISYTMLCTILFELQSHLCLWKDMLISRQPSQL